MVLLRRVTAVGVFQERTAAGRAVEELRQAGFHEEQFGVAVRRGETGGSGSTAADSGTRSEEGAAAGAVTGGAVGALVGALATGLIPGLGPVLAGGLLAGILSGAAVGAAAGGVLGALVGMGVPEDEARYYEDEFHGGRTLVTVKADGRYDEAVRILRRHGAYDVNTDGVTAGRTTWLP
jgi:hypothetical protein